MSITKYNNFNKGSSAKPTEKTHSDNQSKKRRQEGYLYLGQNMMVNERTGSILPLIQGNSIDKNNAFYNDLNAEEINSTINDDGINNDGINNDNDSKALNKTE